MTTDDTRRIRLTFGQVAWAISVLVVLVGQWIRFEVRLTALENIVSAQHSYTRSEIDLMAQQSMQDRSELRRRIERLEARMEHR